MFITFSSHSTSTVLVEELLGFHLDTMEGCQAGANRRVSLKSGLPSRAFLRRILDRLQLPGMSLKVLGWFCLCWRLEKTGSCAGFKKVSPRYGNPTMQVQHGWRSKDAMTALMWWWCHSPFRSDVFPEKCHTPQKHWDIEMLLAFMFQIFSCWPITSGTPQTLHRPQNPSTDFGLNRTCQGIELYYCVCVCVCGEGYGSQCGIHAEMFTRCGLFSSVEHPRISRAGVSTPRFKVTWLAAHGPNQKRVVMKRCFPDCSFRGRGANRCAAWWYLMVLDGWIPHLRWCTEHEISLFWCVKVQLPGVVSSGDVLYFLFWWIWWVIS